MALSADQVSRRIEEFRALHIPGNPFILANAWDIGSAKMLSALGAKALATTSAGHAFTLGRPDMGYVSRQEAIDHAIDLNEATQLPVNGDLENGYGDSVDDVRETVIAASKAGIAGLGIEDTALPDSAPYKFNEAIARIEAAVDAKREAPTDIFLTARADGIMNGHYDLAEAIKRLKAFEKAGVDCVYAPLPPDMDALADICRSVEIPVNGLCAGKFTKHSLDAFANAGIARVSIGSALARVTHKVILDSAKAMFENGDMSSLANTANGNEIDKMLLSEKP